jgi:hypothetical protein
LMLLFVEMASPPSSVHIQISWRESQNGRCD